MYVAAERDPKKENKVLQESISQGLEADVFDERMPDELQLYLVNVHNQFHGGSKTGYPEQIGMVPKETWLCCCIQLGNACAIFLCLTTAAAPLA